MRVLVIYASKHSATQEIAERIAGSLHTAGVEADVRPAKTPGSLSGYDAFVIGSAVYYGSWLREATGFVDRNKDVLENKPVWLFSSGPISSDTIDAEGNDLREATEPKQIAGFQESLNPRDHHVFYGVLDRGKLRFADRLIASLPAFPGEEGDFRDWDEIEAWTNTVVQALRQNVAV
jgi:menaquinone-dependent protoporphyrinogen oxidase